VERALLRARYHAGFLGRSPDTATGDDLRRFQLAQVEQGAQPPKMNAQASALRFFLTITLGRADLAHQLARTYYPRKLPRVLAPDQVALLLEAAPGPGLKYKAALGIAYGAGLRGGEVVEVADIFRDHGPTWRDANRGHVSLGQGSRQANPRATGRPRCRPPSGSIRRELAQHHPPSHYRSVSSVQDRPRASSSQPLSGQTREAQIGVKLPLPSVPSRVASTAPPHDHSATHISSGDVPRQRAEIPIVQTATPPPTSRAFLL
jgi:integrase